MEGRVEGIDEALDPVADAEGATMIEDGSHIEVAVSVPVGVIADGA